MTSSDRPTRWGILATGGIAAAFTEDLLAVPGAEVAAVASRTESSAQAFADRFGIPRAYGSWAELAADPGIDVVYVATPHAAHLAATTLMLESGKAVLCEKPFTLNARQAEQLVATARAQRSFLMEAMWMYLNPAVRRIVELVRDGAIGEVRAVHADFGFPAVADPAHRLWDLAAGGGALLDLGVYPVSFAHLLLGEPEQVKAVATLTPEGVDEHTAIVLGHAGGALSLLSCSLVAGYGQRASVHGSTGRIELPADFFQANGFVLHRDGKPAEEYVLDRGPGHGLGLEAAEVVRCLRAGLTESPLVPLDGTLAVMRTLDAVRAQIGVRYPDE
ncbi:MULTISPECIES: Gfo/Idh/MocA family protein [unclassified Kitasatospora]|uniref:Gfo/Idh/MocA family protein n=1 Tax=unclassified Kitasatospora TaxID=2633591 RepID=UPI00070BA1B8|nr:MULTISPECIES: Gfo/Idh/MocA family oxidoreductase [unclassified Kitasatospora]KQV11737.1 oxidoreductase [Kitasatospora sp. Root107]KRB76681.1 oxidoreductase [Kitasatospora sp. Root187]